MVEIKVKNCRTCPFSDTVFADGNIGVNYSHCLAPAPLPSAGQIDSYWKYYKVSPNCPLKSFSVKIELKK